jgi:hypothetical protein
MNTVGDGSNGYPITLIRLKKEWVGLTDEEIEELWGEPVSCMYSGHYNAIRDIEAKLKEKNGV